MKTTSRLANVALETKTRGLLAMCLLAVFTLLVLAGCKDQSLSTTDINPAGVYSLVSVDGKNVPCSLTHEGMTMTINSGVFTIHDDGTCSSLMTFSAPQRENISREVKATYTRKAAELTMKWEGAGTTVGQVDGNKFTMTNEGMVLSYQK